MSKKIECQKPKRHQFLEREKNLNWKGGRTIASNGYMLIKVDNDHHLADIRGYAYEHRIIAEQKLGRKLRPGEQVHHVNGIKIDNQEENIEVVQSVRHHRVKHRKANGKKLRFPGEDNPIICCECGCGIIFLKYDTNGRPRRFISGHNLHPKQWRQMP